MGQNISRLKKIKFMTESTYVFVMLNFHLGVTLWVSLKPGDAYMRR